MVTFTWVPTNVHVLLDWEGLGTSSCSCVCFMSIGYVVTFKLVPTNVHVSYCVRASYKLVCMLLCLTALWQPRTIHVPVDCELFSTAAHV